MYLPDLIAIHLYSLNLLLILKPKWYTLKGDMIIIILIKKVGDHVLVHVCDRCFDFASMCDFSNWTLKLFRQCCIDILLYFYQYLFCNAILQHRIETWVKLIAKE